MAGDLARREQGALELARRELAETYTYIYFQFIAHQQMEIHPRSRARAGSLSAAISHSHPAATATWCGRISKFDLTRSIGTPPDAFSRGQRWGLPMPNWAAMRADGFELWRSRARHARTLYDVVRIDHVVGLYRTFTFGSDLAEKGVHPRE